MNTEKSLLVCGSVHIDIIARSKSVTSAIDKPGEIVFDIGGAANNIAISAKGIGIPTQVLTALSKGSPYTDIIAKHLSDAGVKAHIQQEENLPDAAFCAHISDDGFLYSAISSMPIEQVKFYKDIFEPVILDAKCLIIDCNLSSEMITRLTRYANSVDVPVFISVTSEEKSMRIAGVDVQFAGIFMNKREMMWLARGLHINPSAATLARQFKCPIIVTNGGDGAVLAHPDESDMLHFDSTNMGDVGGGKDYMGAGDTVVAHTIAHHVFGGRKLKDALSIALLAAEEGAACRRLNLMGGGGMTGAIQSISNSAALDHLTNLPNRATAAKKIEQMALRNSDCFVALIDIDLFKNVNDTYGHDIGDVVIKRVAETISSTMREGDFCARWGGEEFLCILGRGIGTIQDATAIMERTRMAVESILWGYGKITVSIGVASTTEVGFDIAIKYADNALYEAKRGGRNMVVSVK